MRPLPILNLAFAILTVGVCASAQVEKPAPPLDDKAAKIVQRAIQAVGGNSYLNIKTVTGRGFITDYRDGVSGIPVRFVDYILYPDRERTEFSAWCTDMRRYLARPVRSRPAPALRCAD